jgi:hypothetical protein
MPKTQRDEARAGADHAMAILDGLTDKWAEEVNLTAMIKNAVSPMNLNSNAPADVRERFKERMEQQVYAIARQAFIEGAYRAITGLQDEKAEMKRLGINRVTNGPVQEAELANKGISKPNSGCKSRDGGQHS